MGKLSQLAHLFQIKYLKSAATMEIVEKSWDLSLYELHRTPHEAITDSTEIAVSPKSLQSELTCPICLEMLTSTMTTKECLHRFCAPPPASTWSSPAPRLLTWWSRTSGKCRSPLSCIICLNCWNECVRDKWLFI